MKTAFDASWQDWIKINIERGCDRAGMAEILMQHEFVPELIEKALGVKIPASPTQGHVQTQEKAQNRIPQRANTIDKLRQNMELSADDIEPHVAVPQAKQIPIQDDKLELFVLENFLSEPECVELINIIRGNLRASTTTNDEGEYANYRTSKTCDLGILKSDFVKEIDRRICSTLGIHESYSESIQAQWYEVGEEFKQHTDYFEPGTDEFKVHAVERGQRTWTFMIYLNTTLQGGHTKFTRVGHQFSPQAGNAIIWNSLTRDGSPNIESMHWGMPVEKGFKVVITKWFRNKGQGEMLRKEPNEYLPSYTRSGFMKGKVPADLFAKLRRFYDDNHDIAVDERVKGFISGDDDVNRAPSELVVLSEELKTETHETLKPLVEAWIGHYLEPTYVYGIRRYLNTSTLLPHRDRGKTHVASCILNIAQDVDEPWPLLIEDHAYRRHLVYLEPGEMVFYEGARLLHGRPQPLKGREFANMFVHYKLVD